MNMSYANSGLGARRHFLDDRALKPMSRILADADGAKQSSRNVS
jgi:hypothetical protein